MDRFSELPESLLLQILSLLPMRDVVRTTILSRSWKNLWTTVPCLNFDDDGKLSSYKFRKFINESMKSWRGIKMQRFATNFSSMPFNSDADSWARFAMERKVESFHVGFSGYRVVVPQRLYTCSSLKELNLTGFRFDTKGINVQWSQLKSLRIEYFDASEAAIEQILCGSPRLEEFSLTLSDCSVNLSIVSTSLKRLSIHIHTDDVRIIIRTPSLETLEISGRPSIDRWMMDASSSLTRATIDFLNYRCSEPLLRGILQAIQHVESLSISDSAIGGIGKGLAVISMMNVKFLELNGRFNEYEEIVSILENFPQLQTLVLDINRYRGKNFERCSDMLERNQPDSYLQELRTVDVTWPTGDSSSMFPFIRNMLKCARKLEKAVFRVEEHEKQSLQKLLRKRRFFANCRMHIICCSQTDQSPFKERLKLIKVKRLKKVI